MKENVIVGTICSMIGIALVVLLTCECSAVKPVAKTVHLTADACVEIAKALGDAEMEAICRTTGDVAQLFERRKALIDGGQSDE